VAPPQTDDSGGQTGTGGRGGRLHGAEAFRLHLTLGIGLTVCVAAFVFEVTRALGGNTLSWAYVFEWPIFAVFAVYMWWHLLHGQDGARRPKQGAAPVATAATRSPGDTPSDGDDADLRAWQAYLRDLEADDARQAEADGPD